LENEFVCLEKNLNTLFKKGLFDSFFSGAAVGVALYVGQKRKVFKECYGKISYASDQIVTPSTFFDLASLTKPLVTTLAVLSLIKEKKLSLDSCLDNYFESKITHEKRDIKIYHLLNHCSGLPAYRPFYKEFSHYPLSERKNRICQSILEEKLEYIPQTKAVYSDLGFILLDSIIEKITGTSLEIYIQKRLENLYGSAHHLIFNPFKKNIKNCAATEKCPWRKKVLCGEVDDENTFSVGGVSGQAGLFGTIDGVLNVTSHLLDIWQGVDENKSIDREQLEYFLELKKVKDSSWVLGFDTPSPEYSSGGKYLSSTSVGHLGFTGTSFWIDPERELVMVLLTNRVHPTRDNETIRQFRPLFHDTVIESLGLN
jgi:serine-type D-Ala-D-Ala carboxypeptidase